MKEGDRVKLIVEKEKYAKEGVHKGAEGIICDPRKIYGCRLVSFHHDWEYEIACIEVKEEDLEVTWEKAVRKEGVTVLLLSDNEKYTKHGINMGRFGVICGKDYETKVNPDEGERELFVPLGEPAFWKVKFEDSEEIISVYYDDIIPIRDDMVEAYRKKIEEELKRRNK